MISSLISALYHFKVKSRAEKLKFEESDDDFDGQNKEKDKDDFYGKKYEHDEEEDRIKATRRAYAQ
jgi:hypothetical protein